MITMQINGITVGDGTTPLARTSELSRGANIVIFEQEAVGLIDPSLVYDLPDSGRNEEAFRLDVTHVIQSAAAAGDIAIVDNVDPALNIIGLPLADLSTADVQAQVSRSFVVPAGYLVRVTGANITGVRLCLTPFVLHGDLEFCNLSVVVEGPGPA